MENLGIDGKLLLAQLINFILFFIIFKKYIAKPFAKFLDQEKKNEKEKETLLHKLKKGEDEAMSKEKAWREKIREERAEILEEAKKEALMLKADILEEAKKEAAAVQVKAGKEIEDEKAKLYQDVKNKVADLSILLMRTALNEYLDEEAKKRITSYILKNVRTIANHEN